MTVMTQDEVADELAPGLWSWITHDADPVADVARLEALAKRPHISIISALDYLLDIGLYDVSGSVWGRALSADLLGCGFVPTVRYERPRRGDESAIGVSYLSFIEFAHMLTRLESWGVPIDPAPAVALAKRQIPRTGLITHAELRLLWWAEERHRAEDLRLLPTPGSDVQQTEHAVTRTGYHAMHGPEGLAVASPKAGAEELWFSAPILLQDSWWAARPAR